MSFAGKARRISLGFETDLWFHEWNGTVVPRKDYLAVIHPENPAYLWGNMLYFFTPPEVGDFQHWTQTFATEFAPFPRVEHSTFGWGRLPASDASRSEFAKRGFAEECSYTLCCTQVKKPTHFDAAIEVRELSSDEDWSCMLENQVAARAAHFSELDYRTFFVPKWNAYRLFVSRGHGKWFGAFKDGQQLGDLGIFVHAGRGRVQRVATRPQSRGTGVCATLLYQATKRELERCQLESIVISADPAYHALRIYTEVGYEFHSKEFILCHPHWASR